MASILNKNILLFCCFKKFPPRRLICPQISFRSWQEIAANKNVNLKFKKEKWFQLIIYFFQSKSTFFLKTNLIASHQFYAQFNLILSWIGVYNVQEEENRKKHFEVFFFCSNEKFQCENVTYIIVLFLSSNI